MRKNLLEKILLQESLSIEHKKSEKASLKQMAILAEKKSFKMASPRARRELASTYAAYPLFI